jgi:hypothetical protein
MQVAWEVAVIANHLITGELAITSTYMYVPVGDQ